MVDDPEKPADEPTKSASDSLPTADQWRQAGKSIFTLVEQTLFALWARLRPFLQHLLTEAENAFTKARSNFTKTSDAPPQSDQPELQLDYESYSVQRVTRLANASLFIGVPSLLFSCWPIGVVAFALGLISFNDSAWYGSGNFTRKKAIGGMLCGALSILLFITGAFSPDTPTASRIPSTTTTPSKPTVNTNTTPPTNKWVTVGYTSYLVLDAWWSFSLRDDGTMLSLNEAPNACYLFVELAVQNNDMKPRSIPPFKLIDDNGAEYQTSANSWLVEGSIGVLDSLNPDVYKAGVIVFDVPTQRRYMLQVSGGYWSGDEALIRIEPRDGKRRN